MTQAINYALEFTIKPGMLESFESASKKCTEAVQSNEPAMNAYQWYFNDDKSKGYVVEWHTDSDSIMAHLQNIGGMLPKLLESCDLTRFDVFGDASEEVKETLSGLGAQFFSYDHGFIR